MHEPVIERLEEYLDGSGPFPEVEEHLRNARLPGGIGGDASADGVVPPCVPRGSRTGSPRSMRD